MAHQIGPNGEKRPSDPIGAAVRMMQIATGQAEETYVNKAQSEGGRKGGKARAAKLSPARRREIAMKGVAARELAAGTSPPED